LSGTGMKERQDRGRLDPRSAAWGAAILVLLLAAWWFACAKYADGRVALERSETLRQAEQYAGGLHLAVGARGALTEGLARFVGDNEASGTLTPDRFDTFAAGQYSYGAGIRTIQVAPDGVIRWTYPLIGNAQAVGLDVLNHPDPAVRADVRRAWESGALTVSAPFELAQGGLGLALRKTVTVGDRRWGIAAIVMDVPPLLADAGLDAVPAPLSWAVEDSNGRVFAGDARTARRDPVVARADLPDGSWTVLLAPTAGWASAAAQDVMTFRLATLAIVGLLTLSSYLLISRQRRLALLVQQRTVALTESERRARALFERSPVSLWQEDFSQVKRRVDALRASGVTDLRAHLHENPDVLLDLVSCIAIIDVNAATVGLYDAGSKKQLLAGLTPYTTPDAREVFVAQMVAVAEGRTEFWGDSVLHTPGGSVRHVAIRWTVMPGFEDDYRSVVVSVVDLTDRVNAQRELDAIRHNLETLVDERTAELIRVNEELVEAQRAKDAFLANMSHELRTPLNSVLGFTGIMLQEIPGPLNDEQRKQLEMVRRSGRQLLVLVNDVLDLAKVEAGHAGIEIADVEVGALTRSVADIARPVVEDRGLRFDVGVPDETVEMRTDLDRVCQILMNLLTNAAKFTAAGAVSLRASASATHAVFEVSDTGPGIPEDQRESIFQPFYQIPSIAAAKSAGTGLGLAIARDLAGLLGGTLTAAASTGGGALFELRLPLRLPEDGGS